MADHGVTILHLTKIVKCTKFLGVHMAENLSFSLNTSFITLQHSKAKHTALEFRYKGSETRFGGATR